MPNKTMCARCGGTLERKIITHQQPWGNELYEFENVPALVHRQCGEIWLEAKSASSSTESSRSIPSPRSTTRCRFSLWRNSAFNPMAFCVRKTEHTGAQRGRGVLWGIKHEAKSQSGKVRRRNAKREIREAEPDLEELLSTMHEQLGKLREKKYRITKAISQSTEEYQTGRYEGPED